MQERTKERDREILRRFEALCKKRVLYQGAPVRISEPEFRGAKVFFSMHSKTNVYDFAKTYPELEVFMRRIVEITDVVPKHKVINKGIARRSTSTYYGATVWKDKGVVTHLAFSREVSELDVFLGTKRLEFALPVGDKSEHQGKVILIPCSSKGMKLFKKGDRYGIRCNRYKEYFTYKNYSVSLSKNADCLILTPITL